MVLRRLLLASIPVALVLGCAGPPPSRALPEPPPFVPLRYEGQPDSRRYDSSTLVPFGVPESLAMDAVPPGLDILSASVTARGDRFVFEVEMQGDIAGLLEREGRRVQVSILLGGADHRGFDSLCSTTDDPTRALVTSRTERDAFLVDATADDRWLRARLETPHTIHAEVVVEAEGRRVRLVVPASFFERRDRWGWRVQARFLPPPAEPIPTDVPGLHHVPVVVDEARLPPEGSEWGAGSVWHVRVVEEEGTPVPDRPEDP